MPDIGEFPKDWKVVELREIVEQRKEVVNPAEEDPSMPFLSLEHVNSGDIRIRRYGKASEVKSTKYRFYKNDILYGKLRPYLDKAVIADMNGICSTDFIVMKTKKAVLPDFLVWVLHTKRFIDYATSTMTGTNHPRTSWKAISKFKIGLPPLEEQKKIAEILNTIDNIIDDTINLIDKLRAIREKAINLLITGSIWHKDFVKTDIGEFPKDWSITNLESISSAIYYGVTAKAVDKNTGLRMLRTTDIVNYQINYDSLPYCEITSKVKDIKKYLLRKGDIIVARSGTVGISTLVNKDYDDVVFGSYLIKIRPKQNIIYPEFLHYYFQSAQYWKQISKAQGSTLKNINLNILKLLLVPIPPLEEQKKIVEILSTIDKKIEVETNYLEALKKLKEKLLSELMTGRIRVNNISIGDIL